MQRKRTAGGTEHAQASRVDDVHGGGATGRTGASGVDVGTGVAVVMSTSAGARDAADARAQLDDLMNDARVKELLDEERRKHILGMADAAQADARCKRESIERMLLAAQLGLEDIPRDNPDVTRDSWSSMYNKDKLIEALFIFLSRIEKYDLIDGASPEDVAAWVSMEFEVNKDTATKVNKYMFGRFLQPRVFPSCSIQSWAQLRDMSMIDWDPDDPDLLESLQKATVDEGFKNHRGELCPTFRLADAFDAMCATGTTAAEEDTRGTAADLGNFHDADVTEYGTGGPKEDEIPEPNAWAEKSERAGQGYIDWALRGNTLVIHTGGRKPLNAVLTKISALPGAVTFSLGKNVLARLRIRIADPIMCKPHSSGRTSWGPRFLFIPANERSGDSGDGGVGAVKAFLNYPNPGTVGFSGKLGPRGTAEVVQCMFRNADLILNIRGVQSPEPSSRDDFISGAALEFHRLQLMRDFQTVEKEKVELGEGYMSASARGGKIGGKTGGKTDATPETKAAKGYGEGETKWIKGGIGKRRADGDYAAIVQCLPPDFLRIADRKAIYLRAGTKIPGSDSDDINKFKFLFERSMRWSTENCEARGQISAALRDNPLWDQDISDAKTITVYDAKSFEALPRRIHENHNKKGVCYRLLQIGYTFNFKYHLVTESDKEASTFSESDFDDYATEGGDVLDESQIKERIQSMMLVWDMDNERLKRYGQ